MCEPPFVRDDIIRAHPGTQYSGGTFKVYGIEPSWKYPGDWCVKIYQNGGGYRYRRASEFYLVKATRQEAKVAQIPYIVLEVKRSLEGNAIELIDTRLPPAVATTRNEANERARTFARSAPERKFGIFQLVGVAELAEPPVHIQEFPR